MEIILPLDKIRKENIDIAGGKGANLGELSSLGFPVPKGFVVTTEAFFDFLAENRLENLIQEKLRTLDVGDIGELEQVSSEIRAIVESAAFNSQLADDIQNALMKLSCRRYAVRSSATVEDLPSMSFAGQHDSFLDVRGGDVLESVRRCWSSLFTPRAIKYRRRNKIPDGSIGMAVVVQEMIEADISGVIWTLDPIYKYKKHILIQATFGRGDKIVSGEVIPNSYSITRDRLRIVQKDGKEKIDQDFITEVAELGQKIEAHYEKEQEIEFAIKGSQIFILQSRPITV